jgi:hypothetical protein
MTTTERLANQLDREALGGAEPPAIRQQQNDQLHVP